MVFDASLHNTLHYNVRIKSKWSHPDKEVVPSLCVKVISNEKRAFGLANLVTI